MVYPVNYDKSTEVSAVAGTDVVRSMLTDLVSVSALLHWCSQEKRHDHLMTLHFLCVFLC